MQRTLIIQLLQTFSVDEMQKLSKFIRSEYFHTHVDTRRFFEIIKGYYPEFDSEKLEPEYLHNQLFPGKVYDDSIMRTLRKYLLRSILDFLTIYRVQQEKKMSQLYLLEELADRGVYTIFNKQVRQMEKILESAPYADTDFLLVKFLFNKLMLEFQFVPEKRDKSPTLEGTHEHLDQFYLASKLEIICSTLNNRLIVGKPTSKSFFTKEVLMHLEQNLDEYPALIRAYFYAAEFLRIPEKGKVGYDQFMILMNDHSETFSTKDQTQLFFYAIGYANYLYRKGNKEYLDEMFNLYKKMTSKDLLFQGDFFPVHSYKNIVTLGLRLEQYDWTEKFIEKYKSFIPEEFREGMYKYNLAHLYFYREKYGEALRLMQDLEFLDTFYQLGYKMLQLKIFYQQQDVDSFFTYAKTFQNHINRQEDIPEERLMAFHNFVKLLRQLFRIKIQEKYNLDDVYLKIKETSPIIEKEWLLKKWEELQ